LAYHTVTDRWFELGELPFAPRCGAAVLRLSDGTVLLASGETGPGVRTQRYSPRDCRSLRFHTVRHSPSQPLKLPSTEAVIVSLHDDTGDTAEPRRWDVGQPRRINRRTAARA